MGIYSIPAATGPTATRPGVGANTDCAELRLSCSWKEMPAALWSPKPQTHKWNGKGVGSCRGQYQGNAVGPPEPQVIPLIDHGAAASSTPTPPGG